MNTSTKKGFTLLELLIVISIIAILSVILIVALNPAETLRKARDTQRLSDLASLKTAIGIYVTSDSSINLDGPDDGSTGNELCENGSGTDSTWVSDPDVTDVTLAGNTSGSVIPASLAAAAAVDGTGWLPVDLASLTGGSPISNMPLDPVNDCEAGDSTCAAVTNAAQMYRYMCDANDSTFEIATTLESTAFTTAPDDKRAVDGGNHATMYEVGTKLTIIPATDDY